MAGKILGLDFGLERIGVAVSYGTLAEPLTILLNNDSPLDAILSLCHQHGITKVVVGLSESDMAEKTKRFVEKLEETLPVPIVMEDEALSSVEVQARLRQTREGKQQHRGPIDHYAAALILERYLEEHPEETA